MNRFTTRLFVFIAVICWVASLPVVAQKQIVLLKGQKVKLRLYPGDDIVYKLKGSTTIKHSYVNNIFDTAVVAHKDVIPFQQLDRLYFKQSNFANVVGGLLVVGGVGYFLIDQLNVVVVQGNDFTLDDGVVRSTALMVGVGLPMMLIKKKSQRIGGRFRLRVVDKGSAFYKPDMRKEASIFMDN